MPLGVLGLQTVPGPLVPPTAGNAVGRIGPHVFEQCDCMSPKYIVLRQLLFSKKQAALNRGQLSLGLRTNACSHTACWVSRCVAWAAHANLGGGVWNMFVCDQCADTSRKNTCMIMHDSTASVWP